jgi:hypothetical protein
MVPGASGLGFLQDDRNKRFVFRTKMACRQERPYIHQLRFAA